MAELTISNKKERRVHPQKFALWLAMASIIMMFAALTSAYIVRQAAGNWLEYRVPGVFYISTLVIVLSSVTLHLSYRSFLKSNERWYKLLLIISFILGALFIALQYNGWFALYDIGVEFTGNPSGSFFYVISGVHALHVLGGIACLLVALVHAYMLPFYVSNKRKVRFELVVQYWHFVDLLWVYLFVFILLQH